MKNVAGLLALIVYLGMLGVLVRSSNTSKIVGSLGSFFNGSLQTAEAG